MSHLYELVALDLGGVVATPMQLLERLEGRSSAPISVNVRQVSDPRIATGYAEEGDLVTEARYVIDGRALRNTEAHNVGYHAGYIVHTVAMAEASA